MIPNVVCRGFGPSASVAFVVTRGYSNGVPAVVPSGGGVGAGYRERLQALHKSIPVHIVKLTVSALAKPLFYPAKLVEPKPLPIIPVVVPIEVVVPMQAPMLRIGTMGFAPRLTVIGAAQLGDLEMRRFQIEQEDLLLLADDLDLAILHFGA